MFLKMIPIQFIAIALALIMMPNSGYAYLGPGLGVGTIAVFFGIIFSVLLIVFSLFWYPFKRLLIRLNILRDKKSNKKNLNDKF